MPRAFTAHIKLPTILFTRPARAHDMLLTLQLNSVAVAGVSSHLVYFIHGEHHIQAPKIFMLFLAMIFTIFFIASCLDDLKEAVLFTICVVSSYSIALFGSIVTYRVFFHRLHKFPGPPMAKVSKFWNVVKASKSTNFRLMEVMRNRYGDFVRTGRRKISY